MAVKWYGDQILARVKLANKAMLTKAAFAIEAQTKVNITNNGQVDTGFMRNSVYAVAPDGESVNIPASGDYASHREGRSVIRRAASPVGGGDNTAVVGVAASYALYQENKKPFLYPAVVGVAGSMGGEIVAVGRSIVDG